MDRIRGLWGWGGGEWGWGRVIVILWVIECIRMYVRELFYDIL